MVIRFLDKSLLFVKILLDLYGKTHALSLCAPLYQGRWCWSTAVSGHPGPGNCAVRPLVDSISSGSLSLFRMKCCRDSRDPRNSNSYSPAHLWGPQEVLEWSLGSLPHHYTPGKWDVVSKKGWSYNGCSVASHISYQSNYNFQEQMWNDKSLIPISKELQYLTCTYFFTIPKSCLSVCVGPLLRSSVYFSKVEYHHFNYICLAPHGYHNSKTCTYHVEGDTGSIHTGEFRTGDRSVSTARREWWDGLICRWNRVKIQLLQVNRIEWMNEI